MNTVHPAAARGFADAAETYQRGRPDYPAALARWLSDVLGLRAGKTVVDLGAGTGKFTKLLVRSGATVVAVEPVEAMRQRLMAALPAVTAVAGTAQDMPMATAVADAVVCAQAFHWFASAEALEEIRRVLKPGAVLCLVWNERDERVDWVAAASAIISPYEGDAPRFHTGDWRRPFGEAYSAASNEAMHSSGFTDLIETRFEHRHAGPVREVVLDRYMSVSFVAALPAAKRAEVAEQLEQLIAHHPDLANRADVEMPYTTRVFHCFKR